MKNYLFVIIFSLSSAALATDFPDNEGLLKSRIESSSGITGPTYQKIVDELNSLETKYPALVQVVGYGETLQHRTLTLIKIGRKDLHIAKAKVIYIGGTIHGDEYLGVEDKLPRWFLEEGLKNDEIKKFIDAGGSIYISPIVNPDGYEAGDRYNSNGNDLNRDFTVQLAQVTGFTQPETRDLASYLDSELTIQNKTLALTLDYHCCTGALLYPWSIRAPAIPAEDQNKFNNIGRILHENFSTSYDFGTTPDLLGYEARGTSKDYFYEKYHALSLTFEGVESEEDKKFPEHTKMWTDFITYINTF